MKKIVNLIILIVPYTMSAMENIDSEKQNFSQKLGATIAFQSTRKNLGDSTNTLEPRNPLSISQIFIIPTINYDYACPYCEYKTSQSEDLASHRISRHKNWVKARSGRHNYKHFCAVPGCNFSGKAAGLKSHMLIHSGEKPFKCPICSYCSNRKVNLERHKLRHKIDRQDKQSNTYHPSSPLGLNQTQVIEQNAPDISQNMRLPYLSDMIVETDVSSAQTIYQENQMIEKENADAEQREQIEEDPIFMEVFRGAFGVSYEERTFDFLNNFY